jgi:branched-chain amino acid transport system substrate-binding protein
VKNKGVKTVCVMYQDTDFGKEILAGAELQTQKLGIKLAEKTTHKPTDQDFTAQITKLREAKCELIAMGTIVRDSIVPYTTARKDGWNDVIFLGSAAAYDSVVGAAPGMDGFYTMGLTEMPYADSSVESVKKFVADYKKRFNADPNIGAVYGYVAADLTVQGLKNAGKDLTTDSFIKGMEQIKDYHDIFNGPPVSFSDKIRQGANSSFLAEVKGGRWTRVTQPLGF